MSWLKRVFKRSDSAVSPSIPVARSLRVSTDSTHSNDQNSNSSQSNANSSASSSSQDRLRCIELLVDFTASASSSASASADLNSQFPKLLELIELSSGRELEFLSASPLLNNFLAAVASFFCDSLVGSPHQPALLSTRFISHWPAVISALESSVDRQSSTALSSGSSSSTISSPPLRRIFDFLSCFLSHERCIQSINQGKLSSSLVIILNGFAELSADELSNLDKIETRNRRKSATHSSNAHSSESANRSIQDEIKPGLDQSNDADQDAFTLTESGAENESYTDDDNDEHSAGASSPSRHRSPMFDNSEFSRSAKSSRAEISVLATQKSRILVILNRLLSFLERLCVSSSTVSELIRSNSYILLVRMATNSHQPTRTNSNATADEPHKAVIHYPFLSHLQLRSLELLRITTLSRPCLDGKVCHYMAKGSVLSLLMTLLSRKQQFAPKPIVTAVEIIVSLLNDSSTQTPTLFDEFSIHCWPSLSLAGAEYQIGIIPVSRPRSSFDVDDATDSHSLGSGFDLIMGLVIWLKTLIIIHESEVEANLVKENSKLYENPIDETINSPNHLASDFIPFYREFLSNPLLNSSEMCRHYDLVSSDFLLNSSEIRLNECKESLQQLLDLINSLIFIAPNKLILSAEREAAIIASRNSSLAMMGINNNNNSNSSSNTSLLVSSPDSLSPDSQFSPVRIRNLSGFRLLLLSFISLPFEFVRQEILNRILLILSSHNENVLLLYEIHPLSYLIEMLLELSPALQSIILRLLEFSIAVHSQCIPFQEICTLALLLRVRKRSDAESAKAEPIGSLRKYFSQPQPLLNDESAYRPPHPPSSLAHYPPSDSLQLILRKIADFVSDNSPYREIFRESGVLDILLQHFSIYFNWLNRRVGTNDWPKDSLPPLLIDSDVFKCALRTLQSLLLSPVNLKIFRSGTGSHILLSLLNHSSVRLLVLNMLFSFQSDAINLKSLIDFISRHNKNPQLQLDVLNCLIIIISQRKMKLGDGIGLTPASLIPLAGIQRAKEIWRSVGGFEFLFAQLTALNECFSGDKTDAEVELLTRYMESLLHCCLLSLHQNPRNREYFWSRSAKTLTWKSLAYAISHSGIEKFPGSMKRIMIALVNLALENISAVDFNTLSMDDNSESNQSQQSKSSEFRFDQISAVNAIHSPDAILALLRLASDSSISSQFFALRLLSQLIDSTNSAPLHRNLEIICSTGILEYLLIKYGIYLNCSNSSKLSPVDSSQFADFNSLTQLIFHLVERISCHRISASEMKLLIAAMNSSEALELFNSEDNDQRKSQHGIEANSSLFTQYNEQFIRFLLRLAAFGSPTLNFIEFEHQSRGFASLDLPTTLGKLSWPQGSFTMNWWMKIVSAGEINSSPAESLGSPAITGDIHIFNFSTNEALICSAHIHGDRLILSLGGLNLSSNSSPSMNSNPHAERVHILFDKFSFVPGIWYNISLTHERIKGNRRDCILSLFVNGQAIQTIKTNYEPPNLSGNPANINNQSISSTSLNNNNSNNLHGSIGTPIEFALVSSLIWQLTTFFVFNSPLSLNEISTIFHHGPAYSGLFHSKSALQTPVSISSLSSTRISNANKTEEIEVPPLPAAAAAPFAVSALASIASTFYGSSSSQSAASTNPVSPQLSFKSGIESEKILFHLNPNNSISLHREIDFNSNTSNEYNFSNTNSSNSSSNLNNNINNLSSEFVQFQSALAFSDSGSGLILPNSIPANNNYSSNLNSSSSVINNLNNINSSSSSSNSLNSRFCSPIFHFSGGVQPIQSIHLSDSIRNVGGISSLLALLAHPSTNIPDRFHSLFSLLICCISSSPQNMRAMITLNGYQILNQILKAKPQLLTIELVELLFSGVESGGKWIKFIQEYSFQRDSKNEFIGKEFLLESIKRADYQYSGYFNNREYFYFEIDNSIQIFQRLYHPLMNALIPYSVQLANINGKIFQQRGLAIDGPIIANPFLLESLLLDPAMWKSSQTSENQLELQILILQRLLSLLQLGPSVLLMNYQILAFNTISSNSTGSIPLSYFTNDLKFPVANNNPNNNNPNNNPSTNNPFSLPFLLNPIPSYQLSWNAQRLRRNCRFLSTLFNQIIPDHLSPRLIQPIYNLLDFLFSESFQSNEIRIFCNFTVMGLINYKNNGNSTRESPNQVGKTSEENNFNEHKTITDWVDYYSDLLAIIPTVDSNNNNSKDPRTGFLLKSNSESINPAVELTAATFEIISRLLIQSINTHRSPAELLPGLYLPDLLDSIDLNWLSLFFWSDVDPAIVSSALKLLSFLLCASPNFRNAFAQPAPEEETSLLLGQNLSFPSVSSIPAVSQPFIPTPGATFQSGFLRLLELLPFASCNWEIYSILFGLMLGKNSQIFASPNSSSPGRSFKSFAAQSTAAFQSFDLFSLTEQFLSHAGESNSSAIAISSGADAAAFDSSSNSLFFPDALAVLLSSIRSLAASLSPSNSLPSLALSRHLLTTCIEFLTILFQHSPDLQRALYQPIHLEKLIECLFLLLNSMGMLEFPNNEKTRLINEQLEIIPVDERNSWNPIYLQLNFISSIIPIINSLFEFLCSLIQNSLVNDLPVALSVPQSSAANSSVSANSSLSSNPTSNLPITSAEKLRRILSITPIESDRITVNSYFARLIQYLLDRIEILLNNRGTKDFIANNPFLLLNLDSFIDYLVSLIEFQRLDLRCLTECPHLTGERILSFSLLTFQIAFEIEFSYATLKHVSSSSNKREETPTPKSNKTSRFNFFSRMSSESEPKEAANSTPALGVNAGTSSSFDFERVRSTLHKLILILLSDARALGLVAETASILSFLIKNEKFLFPLNHCRKQFLYPLLYHLFNYLLTEEIELKQKIYLVWEIVLNTQLPACEIFLYFDPKAGNNSINNNDKEEGRKSVDFNSGESTKIDFFQLGFKKLLLHEYEQFSSWFSSALAEVAQSFDSSIFAFYRDQMENDGKQRDLVRTIAAQQTKIISNWRISQRSQLKAKRNKLFQSRANSIQLVQSKVRDRFNRQRREILYRAAEIRRLFSRSIANLKQQSLLFNTKYRNSFLPWWNFNDSEPAFNEKFLIQKNSDKNDLDEYSDSAIKNNSLLPGFPSSEEERILMEWISAGILPAQRWRLDFTEGPLRQRKKLQLYEDFYKNYKIQLIQLKRAMKNVEQIGKIEEISSITPRWTEETTTGVTVAQIKREKEKNEEKRMEAKSVSTPPTEPSETSTPVGLLESSIPSGSPLMDSSLPGRGPRISLNSIPKKLNFSLSQADNSTDNENSPVSSGRSSDNDEDEPDAVATDVNEDSESANTLSSPSRLTVIGESPRLMPNSPRAIGNDEFSANLRLKAQRFQALQEVIKQKALAVQTPAKVENERKSFSLADDSGSATAAAVAMEKLELNTIEEVGTPKSVPADKQQTEKLTAAEIVSNILNNLNNELATPSKADSDAAAAANSTGLADEISEFERLLRFLDPADEILPGALYACHRISGLDKLAAVSVLSAQHLYLIDGFTIIPVTETLRAVDNQNSADAFVVSVAVRPPSESATGVESKTFRAVNSPDYSAHGFSDSSGRPLDFSLRVEKAKKQGFVTAAAMLKQQKEPNFLANSADVDEDSGFHSCLKLPHHGLREIHKRRYQLMQIGLEIFYQDGSNVLLVFDSPNERDYVHERLVQLGSQSQDLVDLSSGSYANPFQSVSAPISALDAFSIVHSLNTKRLKSAKKLLSDQWSRGEISNFAYLMFLNSLAGRTYNDLTQYPVFPWVLADYHSEQLDLSDPKSFRDLSKPMGALDPDRAALFQARFESWDEKETGQPAFFYGSHYSSAAIVLYYLLRLEPFTKAALQLQNGKFDHADRLFHDLSVTWRSASAEGGLSFIPELIPEFFYLPDFLSNSNQFDLGEHQRGGHCSDVKLPPWAHKDPRVFIRLNRRALESKYVSEHLHEWIDLIFGCKQRGKAAIQAQNVFFYLTYEDAIDVNSITDELEKRAILEQINSFGQCCRQLFKKPHPQRQIDQKGDPKRIITVGTHPQLLLLAGSIQSTPGQLAWVGASTNLNNSTPSSATVQRPIGSLAYQSKGDRLFILDHGKRVVPGKFSKYLSWGHADCSIRFSVLSVSPRHRQLHEVVAVHEGLHDGQISQAIVTESSDFIVTGGFDCLVKVWRIHPKLKYRQISHAATLCGHFGVVTQLVASSSFSILVSGGADCNVFIWDFNRLTLTRALPRHPQPITAIAINQLTGDIVTSAGPNLYVWTINGDLAAEYIISDSEADSIDCLAFSLGPDYSDDNCVITGHRDGTIRLWNLEVKTDQLTDSESDSASSLIGSTKPFLALELRHALDESHNSGVCCLLTTPSDYKRFWSADRSGRVLSWNISTDAHWEADAAVEKCAICQTKFSPLNRRHHCRQCGSVVCGKCSEKRMELPNLGFHMPVRICDTCATRKEIGITRQRSVVSVDTTGTGAGVGSSVDGDRPPIVRSNSSKRLVGSSVLNVSVQPPNSRRSIIVTNNAGNNNSGINLLHSNSIDKNSNTNI